MDATSPHSVEHVFLGNEQGLPMKFSGSASFISSHKPFVTLHLKNSVLGHPSINVLNNFLKRCNLSSINKTSTDFCVAFSVGKSHQFSSSHSFTLYTHLFQLIFCDRWDHLTCANFKNPFMDWNRPREPGTSDSLPLLWALDLFTTNVIHHYWSLTLLKCVSLFLCTLLISFWQVLLIQTIISKLHSVLALKQLGDLDYFNRKRFLKQTLFIGLIFFLIYLIFRSTSSNFIIL